VYQDNVTVKAFLVNHGEVPQAFGYRFETPDRTIVISGDTSPSQSVIDNCDGCDILVHEVMSTKGNLAAAPAWQAYSLKYHTSTAKLAELATKARQNLLILYRRIFADLMLQEMQDAYKGQFVSGLDLDIY
jgi:ribonuclease BN (tRNA processing enzyme)